MKRKLLPVFLSFALLANGSLTAFATDSSVDTVTESDAQTTVSEDQENPEELLRKKFLKTKRSSWWIWCYHDFETAYKAYTFGANVSGPDAISADKNTVAVLDVRSSANYDISHLEGSFSTPVFNEDGSIIQTSEDATAKAFTETVTNNRKFPEQRALPSLQQWCKRGSCCCCFITTCWIWYQSYSYHYRRSNRSWSSLRIPWNKQRCNRCWSRSCCWFKWRGYRRCTYKRELCKRSFEKLSFSSCFLSEWRRKTRL